MFSFYLGLSLPPNRAQSFSWVRVWWDCWVLAESKGSHSSCNLPTTQFVVRLRQEDPMSTQRIDLSNLNVEMPTKSLVAEHRAPKETVTEENEQAAPDEFEARRKAFVGA